MLGDQALEKLLRDYEFETVLDIGSGRGAQAAAMREAGKKVTTLDCFDEVATPDICAYYPQQTDLEPQSVIWCCHTLEHQWNQGQFLDALYSDLKEDGVLAITVPPFRQVVPGHITVWNAGLLLYNLVLANFDCSGAAVKTYGYNISVIVRKGRYSDGSRLDTLNDLAEYFPVPLTGDRPKLGVLPTDIEEVNW